MPDEKTKEESVAVAENAENTENTENKEAEAPQESAKIEEVVSEDAPIAISKEDLDLIMRKQNEIQNAFTTVGMLEIRKGEIVANISGAKKLLQLSIDNALEKVGIAKENAADYIIHPRTGQVSRKEDVVPQQPGPQA